MKRFQEKLIKNLPDYYNKDPTSNNAKLMQLIEYDREQYRILLQTLYDSLDLDNAKGYTLDLYGEMVGQKRGLATDAQYLVLIKAKLARNMCSGNNKSIVKCLCLALGCSSSEISIIDAENPATVALQDIPLSHILKADLTPNQFTQIVKTLLPAGVTLESSIYGGTLIFSDEEFDYDEDSGFCENEGDTVGGYFGVLSDDKEDTVLPI